LKVARPVWGWGQGVIPCSTPYLGGRTERREAAFGPVPSRFENGKKAAQKTVPEIVGLVAEG
jgi:hypothetical protein